MQRRRRSCFRTVIHLVQATRLFHVAGTAMRLLTFFLLFTAFSVHAEERLRIHGSNTVGETLAPALVQRWLIAEGFSGVQRSELAFEEIEIRGQRDGVERIVEIHAHGSSTAFADMAEGRADLGMSSRPVRDADRALHPRLEGLNRPEQEVVLALDGLAVIVHPESPLRALRKDQVRQVFTGSVRDWSQLTAAASGAIRLHARDDRSGTFDSFKSLVLDGAPLAAQAKRYESTEQLAAAVAADPLAIGFVGLSGLRGVRALAISDGGAAMAPNIEDVAVEDYPLSRRLYFYLPGDASLLARGFVEFSISGAGQQEAEKVGFVSQNIRAYAAQPRPDVPREYRSLVESAERLSLNFRFGAGSSLLDSKTLRDLDRLAAFMKRADNGQRPLILLGFSDAVETLPAMAVFISTDRADYIAHLLVQRGVDPSRVRGLGGVAPVAANDSDIGRQRNRRVEVWLGEPGGPAASLARSAEVSPLGGAR
jgi:phosphate transport system substrate-binding protein